MPNLFKRTVCECSVPGWCNRHNRFMSTRLHVLCQKGQPPPPLKPSSNGDQPYSESTYKFLLPEALPCVYRGPVTRQENCRLEQCIGGALFDVFRCDIHTECSIDSRAVPKLTVCKKCKDRVQPVSHQNG